MEDFQRLLSVVAATLNKPADEVAEAAKSDEGIATLTDTFKAYRKAQYDAGHKASKKEATSTVEAALRKRGAADASFDDLDSALDALETSARQKAGQALSDDDALRLPVVKAALTKAENEKMLAISTASKDAETKLQAQIDSFRKEQQDAKVAQAAEAHLAELNPNFNADPVKAARQKARVIAEIKNGKYELGEDGTIKPLQQDGVYLPNAHGHPVSFADYVRSAVEESGFDLPVSQPRQSASLTPEQVAAGQGAAVLTHFKGALPKSEQEYITLANDPNLPADALTELRGYWQAQAAT
ncbi:hypothetical protein BEN47_06105 [Hymenobacter lapidarius]|uniref:Uncharacterized protein n=1 Tax=Hymenobacter lapidarius TaxID=1908237 RepID=A0A1G1SQD1_9BACT|nr:hypothetical protein [Hymenobacter lapidarius]OGX80827.1 hypothetical protein BEN47_06105 [Hymenobacter lapidarius]